MRLPTEDLETIVELASTAPTDSARDILRRIAAGHAGGGAAEVIRGILDRGADSAPRPFTRVEAAPRTTDPVLHPAARRAGMSLAAPGEGPTSALLVGAPGSGRTTFARWIAGQRRRPLWSVDLALAHDVPMDVVCADIRRATDSGGTAVLEHAEDLSAREPRALRQLERVIGEQVTGVVLAEADTAAAPLLASVFSIVVELSPLTVPHLRQLLERHLGRPAPEPHRLSVLAALSSGETPEAIVRSVARAHRFAEISGVDRTDALFGILHDRCLARPLSRRRDAAWALVRYASLSQRTAGEMTGVSRDTLRRQPPV